MLATVMGGCDGMRWRARALALLLLVLPGSALAGGDNGARLEVRWSSPVLTMEVSMAWYPSPCARKPLLRSILDDITEMVEIVEEELVDLPPDALLHPRRVPRQLEVRADVGFAHEGRLVSWVVTREIYAGGAHGLYATQSWLVELESCTLIKREQLLDWQRARTAWAQALTPVLVEAKRRRGWLDPGEEVVLRPEDLDQASVGLLSGPAGRSCGLRFDFAPYVLGPFAEGAYTLLLPASKVRPFVRPAHRDLFAPPDAKACEELQAFLP